MAERTLASVLSAGALVLLAPLAHANDFAVGGSGADLVPVQEKRVRMQSEDIIVSFEGETIDVTADYAFTNLTNESVTMQVGFPEMACPPDVDCVARFWDLQTTVNGSAVKHTTGTLTQKHAWSEHLGKVWLFDATFPASSTTKIRHRYKTTPGGSVDQEMTFDYVTRTGATWFGNIGRASFTLKLPPEVHTVSNTMGKPVLIQPEGGPPYVQLHLEHRDWEPKTDLHVEFHFTPMFAPYLGDDRLTRSGVRAEDECGDILDPKTPEQLQTCKNLAYAISGFSFKRPELAKYFYGGKKGWSLLTPRHAERFADGETNPPKAWVRGLQEFTSFDLARMPAATRALLKQLDERAATLVPSAGDSSARTGAPGASSSSVGGAATTAPSVSAPSVSGPAASQTVSTSLPAASEPYVAATPPSPPASDVAQNAAEQGRAASSSCSMRATDHTTFHWFTAGASCAFAAIQRLRRRRRATMASLPVNR